MLEGRKSQRKTRLTSRTIVDHWQQHISISKTQKVWFTSERCIWLFTYRSEKPQKSNITSTVGTMCQGCRSPNPFLLWSIIITRNILSCQIWGDIIFLWNTCGSNFFIQVMQTSIYLVYHNRDIFHHRCVFLKLACANRLNQSALSVHPLLMDFIVKQSVGRLFGQERPLCSLCSDEKDMIVIRWE